ncbi:hypothetical protein ACOSP7_017496 [Xanthoceras sorbifolium]
MKPSGCSNKHINKQVSISLNNVPNKHSHKSKETPFAITLFAEKFVSKGNAFVVHGGSEGIYSSVSDTSLNESDVSADDGDAYICYEKIRFQKSEENHNFNSPLIHALVLEVEDRETIGGEVIVRPSARDSSWPQVFGVAFKENKQVAKFQSKSQINLQTDSFWRKHHVIVFESRPDALIQILSSLEAAISLFLKSRIQQKFLFLVMLIEFGMFMLINRLIWVWQRTLFWTQR